MYDDPVKKPAGKEPQPTFYALDAGTAGVHHTGDASPYPQAAINFQDPNAPSVDGSPLYPDETVTNPHLARFVKKGFKDVWAAVLFLAVFLMTIVWGIVNLCKYAKPSNEPVNDGGGMAKTDEALSGGVVIGSMLISFVISLVLASLSLIAMKLYAKVMIIACNVISIGVILGMSIYCFVFGSIFGGIMLIICAGLSALWLYLVRDRIAFPALLLKTSSQILVKNKMILVIDFFLLIVAAGFLVTWCGAILPPTDNIVHGKENGWDIFLICLFVLIFFWVMQVIPNVMRVTAAGVVATWYFAGFDNMPGCASIASFKRAVTTSFGSICFGSLIVAFVQLLHWIAESSRNNNGEMNFIQCIFICLISCIERIVEYFNEYAFVHVAIYGCGYIDAAKRTFALYKQCFFSAYFNHCLIALTLNLITFAISVLIAIGVGAVTRVPGLGVIAFFVSALVHSVFFIPLKSSVTTIFVCFAEVPEALQQSDPELYAAIHSADAGGTNNNAAPPV